MSECHLCKTSISEVFNLPKCKHIICHKCLCQYIGNNVRHKIECPISNCSQYVSDKIIRKCLSNTQVDVYEQSSILAASSKVWKCLTKGCPNIVLIENRNSVFHCYYCDQPNCLSCKKRHYPNECGNINANEDHIENAAIASMKVKRREALESQFQNRQCIPNPEAFECPVCTNFILPREGIIMRNCHHCICKDCFNETVYSINIISKLKCPICESDLNDGEVLNAIGVDNFRSIVNKVAAQKLFCCKSPDCTGMWDCNDFKGAFRCPICNTENCLECEEIHERMSCEEFRKTKRYEDCKNAKQKFKINKGVKCNCGKFLIIGGGCGALQCDTCGRQVCIFTGKEAGNTGPNCCGCTSKVPCHKDCIYGCYPEDKMAKKKP